MTESFDVIIVGAGPAGFTAALYLARAGLRAALFERAVTGGQAGSAARIENYPGFPAGINGAELCAAMEAQALAAGSILKYENITALTLTGELKTAQTSRGEYTARAVIIATGAHARELGVSGEELFTGKGISYCATCDGSFYRGRTVAVVGGGDTAAEDALYLSGICGRVHLIHRRDELRAAKSLADAILSTPNIEIHWDTVVTRLTGEGRLEALILKNTKTEDESILKADGLFVAVGILPNTALAEGRLDLDEQSRIITRRGLHTNITGVFAAGDVRDTELRQIVTACADGAVAAQSAAEYIRISK